MNRDQIETTVRSVLKIGGTFIATKFHMTDSEIANYAILGSGIASALAGFIWGHLSAREDAKAKQELSDTRIVKNPS